MSFSSFNEWEIDFIHEHDFDNKFKCSLTFDIMPYNNNFYYQ